MRLASEWYSTGMSEISISDSGFVTMPDEMRELTGYAPKLVLSPEDDITNLINVRRELGDIDMALHFFASFMVDGNDDYYDRRAVLVAQETVLMHMVAENIVRSCAHACEIANQRRRFRG